MKLLNALGLLTSIATAMPAAERQRAVGYIRHFYTVDLAEYNSYRQQGYADVSDPLGFVYSHQAAGTVPMYRWKDDSKHRHFYTTDVNGELAPAAGYVSDGVAWYFATNQTSDWNQAVRRYDNPNQDDDHMYVNSLNNEPVTAGYLSEGTVGYASSSSNGGKVVVYSMILQ